MIIALLLVGICGVVFCLSQPTDVVRRFALNVMWIAALVYPGVFALLNGRSVYGVESVSPWSSLLPIAINVFHVIIISSSALVLILPNKNHGKVTRSLYVGLVLFLGVQFTVMALHTAWSSVPGWLAVTLVLLVVMQGTEPVRLVEKRIRWALRTYIIASLVAAVVNPDWALVPEVSNSRALFGIQERLIGFTDSSNYLGLISALLFALEMGSLEKKRKGAFFFVCLAFLACLFSQSRTPLLAIAVISGLALAKNAKLISFYRRKVSSLLIFLVSLSVLPVGILVFSGHSSHSTLQEITTNRVSIWQTAFEIFKDFPLLGYGPSVFSTNYWEGVGAIQTFSNAHNQWLESASRGGIIEVFATVCLLIVLMNISSRARPTEYGFVVLAIAVVIFVQLPIGTPFRLSGITWNLVVLAVFFAIGVASIIEHRKNSSTSISCNGKRNELNIPNASRH